MDYLILRKSDAGAAIAPGATLAALWPRLALVTVAELKTTGRPYRTGDLDRLWGYVHTYRADKHGELPLRSDLRAALIVPVRTPSLLDDVDEMGLRWEDLGRGYWQLHGGLFTLYVVELDVVCEQEDDDFLRAFAHQPQRTREGRQFWAELVGTREIGMAMQDMEEYEEAVRQFLSTLTPQQRLEGLAPAQRLEGLAPAQRLEGLPPEERLADLDRDQQALALPVELLRLLPEEYIRSLSAEVQEEIRARLQRATH
jgi:hypothetical protein